MGLRLARSAQREKKKSNTVVAEARAAQRFKFKSPRRIKF